MRGFILPMPGQFRPDVSGADALMALVSNNNNYHVALESIAVTGSSIALTGDQTVTGVVQLTGSPSGAFVIQLLPTDRIVDALGPTIKFDGSFSVPISIQNTTAFTGTLTAPADGRTTLTGVMTVATNARRIWLLHVKPNDVTIYPPAHVLEITNIGEVALIAGSGGTVTSVGLTAPVEFIVSGSPVTSSGTLAISKATELANTFWAGPTSGGAAVPTFRTIVTADIPAWLRCCINPTDPVYGALGNGVHDDTAAVQAAIDAAFALGGGEVCFPAGNYLYDGNLVMRDNVTLTSNISGRTGRWAVSGSGKGVTFSITDTVNPFITSAGVNTKLDGIIFFYPEQVLPTSSVPTVYPYTIENSAGDWQLTNCTFVNSYRALHINAGNVVLDNVNIGYLQGGIFVENAGGYLTMKDVFFGPGSGDLFLGFSFPQNLDTYALTNGQALVFGRCDHLKADSVLIFYSDTGINFTDQASGAITSASGSITNLELSSVRFGVICQSTQVAGGIAITNLLVNDGNGVPPVLNTALWMKTGGNDEPFLSVVNGSFAASGGQAYLIDSGLEGNLNIDNVSGIDLRGAPLTPPAVPGSTVNLSNPFPFPVMVAIAGGTITGVAINGVNIGASSFDGPYTLAVNGIIAIQYSVAPTWNWFAV